MSFFIPSPFSAFLPRERKSFTVLLGPDTPIRADYAAVAGKKILEHQLELSLKNASVTLTSDGEEELRECALSG